MARSKARKSSRKSWASRLGADPDAATAALLASTDVDRELWRYDVAGSIAHAQMLSEVALISKAEFARIKRGLLSIAKDLEAGRLLGYRAAAMQDQGLRSSNEFAVAKYFTTEATQKAAKMAADIHGGYGCMEEYAVTRYLRDSFVLGPSAGTSDIMKVIVGRWVLS